MPRVSEAMDDDFEFVQVSEETRPATSRLASASTSAHTVTGSPHRSKDKSSPRRNATGTKASVDALVGRTAAATSNLDTRRLAKADSKCKRRAEDASIGNSTNEASQTSQSTQTKAEKPPKKKRVAEQLLDQEQAMVCWAVIVPHRS